MRALLLSCFMVSSFASAAGLKAEWKVRALQMTAATAPAEVAAWDYAARKSDLGVLTQIGSGLVEIRGSAPTGNLAARVSFTATDIRGDSSTLRVQLWDTSGLPESSPRYRAFFQADATAKAGESVPIFFTLGDASVSGGSARYQLLVSLDSLTKEP